MSERLSERCDSTDILHEIRSKRINDKPDSKSESEHVSNTVYSQPNNEEEGGSKELASYSTPKEKEKEASMELMNEVPLADGPEPSGSKKTNNCKLFQKIYTFADEKKILKALHESGHTIGSKLFWSAAGSKLVLSIPATQQQLYEKIRRMKGWYMSASGKAKLVMSQQDLRLHRLSRKIWKDKARVSKKAQKQDEEVDEDYNHKLGKFVNELNDVKFPVAECLEVVPASERPELKKKWNRLHAEVLRVYTERIDLIKESLGAVASSPSFPLSD